ncbi:aspartyl-phosphate phosphatase Spo0E family protein [Bacillus sp. J33]|uniref:aspartyl-phosphate phosphatase Spo0E family protein n=1 Tax=Bacillus sp. J33 TaxID=935836 RepID=UPI0004795318|nr:aspartyl-phosphate phosphatase Spo0E family protein [Bacillus sp. J33]
MNELLKQEIEKTRLLMIESIKHNGLSHEKTIQLSQELDVLILIHQNKKLEYSQQSLFLNHYNNKKPILKTN